jgi:hypothetical protein
LPTSKTAAAITKQSPIIFLNMLHQMTNKNEKMVSYDGYTACPIPLGMLKKFNVKFLRG